MSEQKNLPALVEAIAIANRTRPLRLLLVGEGSQETRDAIMALAQDCGIAPNVKLHDAVANPYAFMSRAAVLALPSLWEGSPNVLLEALACGAPVVASRTAGNAEGILAHGRYGELVDPLDPQDIADALLRQCDPAMRILPGDRADAFDLQRSMEGYEAVFAGLVNAPSARGSRSSRPSAGSRSLYR
jgi:glycosyltransferase involved in cell wall biosynthesis